MGIWRFLLVAVQESESFWSRWGFVRQESFTYTGAVPATRMELQKAQPVEVCQATEGDIDQLLSLGQSERGCTVSEQIRFYERTELVEWAARPEDNLLLVAKAKEPKETITGFLFCKVISHHWALLDNFVVKSEFRKQGVGSAMLRALSDRLRGRGIEYLSTLVDVNDSELLEVLWRRGFQQQKQYIWFDLFLTP
jgi:ribosomal protein S18 acetylase RimI-like enzyme